jgi:WD40 repeat protein
MNAGEQESNLASGQEQEKSHTFWLWTMVVLGVLIIAFFGFCIETSPFKFMVHQLHNRGLLVLPGRYPASCPVAHWRSWEMGAVFWSILFGIYYYFTFEPANPASTKAICAIVVLGAVGPNFLAAFFIFRLWPAEWHVGAVSVAAVLFMAADFLLYQKHINPRQKVSFFEGLLIADIPMVVGSIILLSYLIFHRMNLNLGNQDDLDAFTGGAISFQLIASNALFVVSQGGFIRRAWERHSSQNGLSLSTSPPMKTLSPQARKAWAWAGVALMSGLLGLSVHVFRFLGDFWNSWLGLFAAILGLIALAAGFCARRTSRSLAGASTLSSNLAFVLGILALALWVVLMPPELGSMTRLKPLSMPDSGGFPTSVALSSDGSALVRSSSNGTIRVFWSRTGVLKWQARHGGPVNAVSFSPAGNTVASGGDELKLWSAVDGKLRKTQPEQSGLGKTRSAFRCIAFSPDGGLLASGDNDGVIRVWDMRTGKLKRTLPLPPPKIQPVVPQIAITNDGAVLALAFSADGRKLLSGGEDEKIILWNIEDVGTGEPKVFRGFNRTVFSVAISRDGDTLAAGMEDRAVRLWDIGNPQPKRTLGGHKDPVRTLLFSGDDRVLASASADPGIIIWDTQTGEQKRILQANSKMAKTIGLSHDGLTMASGNSDETLNVWRADWEWRFIPLSWAAVVAVIAYSVYRRFFRP